MANYPRTLQERAKLYLHCMVEIKERMNLVQAALNADTADLFKNEICSLQFRHICELIAIACLAAQGDFKTQRAFRESYSPSEIFNALRKIFPHFFPQPTNVTTKPNPDGGMAHHIEANNKPGAYSEADVTTLWAKCGNDLHRASVKKYLKATFSAGPKIEPVYERLSGLVALLDTHIIPIGDVNTNVLLEVRMEDGEGNAVAHYVTVDRETGTAQVEGFRAQLTGR